MIDRLVGHRQARNAEPRRGKRARWWYRRMTDRSVNQWPKITRSLTDRSVIHVRAIDRRFEEEQTSTLLLDERPVGQSNQRVSRTPTGSPLTQLRANCSASAADLAQNSLVGSRELPSDRTTCALSRDAAARTLCPGTSGRANSCAMDSQSVHRQPAACRILSASATKRRAFSNSGLISGTPRANALS